MRDSHQIRKSFSDIEMEAKHSNGSKDSVNNRQSWGVDNLGEGLPIKGTPQQVEDSYANQSLLGNQLIVNRDNEE